MSSSTSVITSNRMTHKWTISNFLLYYQFNSTGNKFENLFVNIFCQSANFKNDHLEFYLKLYPIMRREYDQKFVSLFLYNVSCSIKEVVVRFKLAILDERGQKCNVEWADWIIDCHSGQSRYGFDEYISYKDLLDSSKGLLPKGKLTIFCEITYITDQIIPMNRSISSPFAQMCTDLEDLFNTQKFADVTLLLGDKEFPAHKAILATRSSWFAEMFKKDPDCQTVEILNLDLEVFEKILRFIYCGKIDSLDGLEGKMADAARKFGLAQLQEMCENLMPSKKNSHSKSNFVVHTESHIADKLKELAIDENDHQ